MKLMRDMVVQIHPHGNPEKDPEGIAKLIERVRSTETSEIWLVQFKDEDRILKRKVRRPDLNEPVIISRREPNQILGLERSKFSELKYHWKRNRR